MPNDCAAITPSPATCAMARSMKTMPRLQHLLSERHVRQHPPGCRRRAPPEDAEVPGEIVHLRPPAAGGACRRRGRRDPSPPASLRPRTAAAPPAPYPLGQPVGGLRIVVGLRRIILGGVAPTSPRGPRDTRARRTPGLGRWRQFLHAQPVDQVGLFHVDDDDSNILQSASCAVQRVHRLRPARLEAFAPRLIKGSVPGHRPGPVRRQRLGSSATLRGSSSACGLPSGPRHPSNDPPQSERRGTATPRSSRSNQADLAGSSVPDSCSSTGSQPISSSAPVATSRSAAVHGPRGWAWRRPGAHPAAVVAVRH